ncbi:MAG: M50 family metallopeptidase [Coriobacteriia bacterium]|nr:M50 family metallopeptidase [Coriobacteriia bacterium]
MLEVLSVIFWGLVLLSIIIFIHEMGHYLAARAFGLRVKEFMIGLPGPKLSIKRKDTRFGVTAIPLGGYCLIAGMERGLEGPEVEKALTYISGVGVASEDQADCAGEPYGIDLIRGLDILADWGTVRRYKARGIYHYALSSATLNGINYKEGQARLIGDLSTFIASERKLIYSAKPWWKRVVILLAGSAANLLAAMAILIALIMVNGTQVYTTTIDEVLENSPAAEAGLTAGDQLVSINHEILDSWADFVEELQKHEVGDTVLLGYLHNEREQVVEITLANNEGRPMIGVVPLVTREPVSFLQAAEHSTVLIGMTLSAIMQLLNPATFADTIGQTSSVVGISIEASAAAAAGPFPFILLVAALSISIGFMNLLPIPPLDGGKIIIETIERVTMRRIPTSIINGVSVAGFAALILLLIAATNADIQRYFIGG